MSSYVPIATQKRLPIYYKVFQTLKEQGKISVTSQELANLIKLDSTTIRRDFASIGKFGIKGHGYDVNTVIKTFDKNGMYSVRIAL